MFTDINYIFFYHCHLQKLTQCLLNNQFSIKLDLLGNCIVGQFVQRLKIIKKNEKN